MEQKRVFFRNSSKVYCPQHNTSIYTFIFLKNVFLQSPDNEYKWLPIQYIQHSNAI